MIENSDYGQAHYMMFHRLLPTKLRNESLELFIELCEAGGQGDYLADSWSDLVARIQKEGGAQRLRGAPSVTADSFPLLLDSTVEEHRLVVIGTPPPHMTPQARYIACWFDASEPRKLCDTLPPNCRWTRRPSAMYSASGQRMAVIETSVHFVPQVARRQSSLPVPSFDYARTEQRDSPRKAMLRALQPRATA